MENKDIKTIIVLGMHKSGTSVIAGVLTHLGVNMGKTIEEESKRDDISNPLGHYEDWDFQKLNKEILKKANGNWNNPPLKKDILNEKSSFKEEIKDLIQKKEQSIFWGWKDPRTSLTINLFLPYLKNPYFLICHRKDKNIIDSIQRRIADRGDKKMSQKEIQDLISIYKQSIKDFFNKNNNLKKLDIDFENIKNNQEKYIKKIIDFLKLSPTKEQKDKAIKFILPKEKLQKFRLKNLIRKGLKKPWKAPSFLIRKLKSN